MRARIVDNLLEAVERVLPNEGHRRDPAFLALAARIQGRVVDLRFVGADAFEASDNNYWLPNTCWTRAGQADEDGCCDVCGCEFEDPRLLTHECPPGFSQRAAGT